MKSQRIREYHQRRKVASICWSTSMVTKCHLKPRLRDVCDCEVRSRPQHGQQTFTLIWRSVCMAVGDDKTGVEEQLFPIQQSLRQGCRLFPKWRCSTRTTTGALRTASTDICKRVSGSMYQVRYALRMNQAVCHRVTIPRELNRHVVLRHSPEAEAWDTSRHT